MRPSKNIGFLPTWSESTGKINEPTKHPIEKQLPIYPFISYPSHVRSYYSTQPWMVPVFVKSYSCFRLVPQKNVYPSLDSDVL